MTKPAEDYSKLSVEERLRLIEEIWASVVHDQPDLAGFTADQWLESDRRADELRAHPERGISWETVRAQLMKQLE